MSDTKKEFEATARTLAKKLIDYALKEGKASGITDAEIHLSKSIKTNYSVEDSALASEVTTPEAKSIRIKIFAGDKALSFSSNNFNEADIKATIKENIEAIHLVPGNPKGVLLENDKLYTGADENLDQFDPISSNRETLIDYAIKAETAALAVPGVKTSRSVSILRSEFYKLHVATNGIDKMHSATLYRASAEIIAEKKGIMEVCYEGSHARHFEDMEDPSVMGTRAGQNAVAQVGATLPDTSEMPIVLSQDAAEVFFSSIYSAIKGQSAHMGTTFWRDKLGQQVMNKEVTLVDNPRIPRGVKSSVTDGTGQESKEITFVKNGVLQQFNHDLTSARQMGVDPIGRNNGPTNSSILPGTETPENLLKGIKKGIYIDDFTGGFADTNTGTFSRQARGKMIENGKIIEDKPVSGFVVAGDLKKMFKDLVLGNDTPKLPSTRHGLAAPSTRINKVKIAGK